MSDHRPADVRHLGVVEFFSLKQRYITTVSPVYLGLLEVKRPESLINSLAAGKTDLERVPVLSLDLAPLHGSGGVEVVGQGGQGGLAGVQLGLPADLPALQVEVRLGRLQPGPAPLLLGPERSAELLGPVERSVVVAVGGLVHVQVLQAGRHALLEGVELLHLVGPAGVALGVVEHRLLVVHQGDQPGVEVRSRAGSPRQSSLVLGSELRPPPRDQICTRGTG